MACHSERALALGEQLKAKLRELSDLYDDYEDLLGIWVRSRVDSCIALYESANYLDDVQKKVNVAKVAGTGVAMGGTLGTIAAVSLILAPATFGASIPAGVATGTATVAIGGTVAAIGADQLKKRKYDKEEIEKMTKILETDAGILDSLLEVVKKMQHLGSEIVTLSEELQREEQMAINSSGHVEEHPEIAADKDLTKGDPSEDGDRFPVVSVGLTGLSSTNLVIRSSGVLAELGAVGAVAATALGGVAIVLGGAGLILGTIRIVKTTKEIHEGNKCELADAFRNKAIDLDKEMQSISKATKEIKGRVDIAMETVKDGLKSWEGCPGEAGSS